MRIKCESCGADLHGRDIVFSERGPRCKACGALVRGGREQRSRKKAPVAGGLPTAIQVCSEVHGGSKLLRIRVPWRLQNTQAGAQLAFVCLLLAVSVVLSEAHAPTLAIIAAIVLLSALFFLVRRINHTLVTVSPGRIAIRHRPIPWLSRSIDTDTVEQLYVDRRPLAQRRFDYSVKVRVHEGDDLIFFRSLSDPFAALQLEQCIESHLEIEDAHVSGEIRPSQLVPLNDSPGSAGPGAWPRPGP